MKFYYCGCYFSHNIYIKEYNYHFKYLNGDIFNKEYDHILRHIGCDNEKKKSELLQKILEEVNRRITKEQRDLERKEFLKKNFQPKDKEIYFLKEKFFHPSFLKLVKAAKTFDSNEVKKYIENISKDKQIFSFPVFTKEFCQRLVNEVAYYNNTNMPKERPNTMNQNGILLDDIGFHDHFSSVLRENYLNPLAGILFPEWRGEQLDSHRIFTVEYDSIKESKLGYHYDNSEVTLNVCIGKSFEGGDIYFGDINSVPLSESSCILVPHTIGNGLLHRGQQFHGTLKVTSGERCNLIIWMRSSSIRNKMCPRCNSNPSLLPAAGYGDGFTQNKKT